MEATIFDDVHSGMTIARDEIFGPVLSVLTFEDALRIANGHDRSMHALRKFSQMKTTWMNIAA